MSCIANVASRIWNEVDSTAGKFERFINSARGVDQAVKNLGIWFQFVTALAEQLNANEEVVETLAGFTAFLKDARVVTGLLNAPRKVKALKSNLKNTKLLVGGFFNQNKDTEIRRKGDYWNGFTDRVQTYHGIGDKFLGIAYELNQSVSSSSFMFAFGICRPISIVSRFYDDMPESVAKVGKAFGVVMMIQNSAILSACFFDTAHELLVYARSEGDDPEAEWKQLKDTFKRHSLVGIDKGCKIITGASSLAGNKIPPLGVAVIEVIGGTVGLVNAWINTQ